MRRGTPTSPGAARESVRGNRLSIFLNRQFALIFVTAFFIYCSSNMLVVTLPKFAHEMGAGAQAVGLLAGIFAMCALLIRPISGQLVDNENRVVMLRIILGVMLVSVAGLTIASTYWMLLVFRGLYGFAWGVGSTLCMTIASSCFPEGRMAGGIGIYGLGQVIAQTIAPIIALPVAERLGFNTLYYGNVALISISLLFTLFMRIEHEPKERRYSISLDSMVCVPAIPPALLTVVNSSAKASINAFLVIYAATIDIGGIAIYFTVQALTIFALRPWISKLSDRLGSLKVLIPCEILLVGGLATISQVRSLAGFVIAAIVMGASMSGEQPILMAECVKSVDPSRRGNASNTSYIGLDIGNFVGCNVAGALVAYMGYSRMYLTMALPIVAYSCVFVAIRRKAAARPGGEGRD